MKKLFFILLILLFATFAQAENLYVTELGAGNQDGSAIGHAWAASDFNTAGNWGAGAGKISAADTVYFSGDMATELLPKGSGTSENEVILDGYEGGDCAPLSSSCSSSAVLKGGLWINGGYDYIIVQDFRMTEGPGVSYRAAVQINSNAEANTYTSDYITFRRNEFYDTDYVMFYSERTDGPPYAGSSNLTLDGNKMVGYAHVYNSATGVGFYKNDNLVVKNNELAGDGTYVEGSNTDNVVELHASTNVLFEYNDIHNAEKQAGIAIKEDGQSYGNQYIIVRFNKIYDNGNTSQGNGRGIYIGGTYTEHNSHHYYIYGNFIYNSAGNTQTRGLDINDGPRYVWIWSNLILNHYYYGISSWERDRGLGWLDNEDILIYNNTISRNNTDTTGSGDFTYTGIYIQHSIDVIEIKNNIFFHNRPNVSGNYQQMTLTPDLTGGKLDLDYNTYFYSGETPTIYHSSGYRTLAWIVANTDWEDNNDTSDPGFNDPDGTDNTHGTEDDNYTLDGSNAGNGVDLSECFSTITIQGVGYAPCLEDGLDPLTTNWEDTPPTVGILKQGDNGPSWERGAYIYPGIDYYVDADASGANNGTSKTDAWESFGDINWTTLDSGDGKLFVCGEHREQLTVGADGEDGTPIQFVNCLIANGASADDTGTISGSDIMSTWIDSAQGQGSTWKKTGVTTEPQQMLGDGSRLIEGSGKATLNDHEWVWDTNELFYRDDSGDPDDLEPAIVFEASQRDYAIYGSSRSYIIVDGLNLKATNSRIVLFESDMDAVIVRNSEISFDGGNGGIVFWATTGSGGNYIDNNNIHDILGAPIEVYDLVSGSGTESYIQDNIIRDAYKDGIFLRGSWNIIQDNDVSDVGHNDEVGVEFVGIHLWAADGVEATGDNNIIRYNKVSGVLSAGNDGSAFEADRWCDDNEFYGNVAFGNDGRCVSLYDADGNKVYNNSCYDNSQDSSGELTTSAEISLTHSGADLTANNLIKNNNLHAVTATYTLFVDAGSADNNNVLDYNLYHRASLDIISWAGTGYDLSEWGDYKSASSQDANSPTPADPQYISSTDLHLQPTSPAIDIAANLGSLYNIDCDGRDQNGHGDGWEMGAYVWKVEQMRGMVWK